MMTEVPASLELDFGRKGELKAGRVRNDFVYSRAVFPAVSHPLCLYAAYTPYAHTSLKDNMTLFEELVESKSQ